MPLFGVVGLVLSVPTLPDRWRAWLGVVGMVDSDAARWAVTAVSLVAIASPVIYGRLVAWNRRRKDKRFRNLDYLSACATVDAYIKSSGKGRRHFVAHSIIMKFQELCPEGVVREAVYNGYLLNSWLRYNLRRTTTGPTRPENRSMLTLTRYLPFYPINVNSFPSNRARLKRIRRLARPLLTLSLLSYAILATSSTLAQEIRTRYLSLDAPYPSDGIELGQGWDSAIGQRMNTHCLEFSSANIDRATSRFEVNELKDTYSLLEARNLTASASGSGFGVTASASYQRSNSLTLNTEYLNYFASYTLQAGGEFVTAVEGMSCREDGTRNACREVRRA